TDESLARELTCLIAHLRWPEVAIFHGRSVIFEFTWPIHCSQSLTCLGVVVQQTLVLPYHQTHPTPLSFRVTLVFLAGTRSVVLRNPKHSLQIKPKSVPRTLA
ncbi:hypothetical protein GGX14DRAFT_350913, partial [Mycena pura]